MSGSLLLFVRLKHSQWIYLILNDDLLILHIDYVTSLKITQMNETILQKEFMRNDLISDAVL